MKSRIVSPPDTKSMSLNPAVAVIGAAAIFLGGVIFGRVLPQRPSGQDPALAEVTNPAREKMPLARNRNDHDWLTAPFSARAEPVEKPAESPRQAAPGAEAPPRAGLLGKGVLGSVLQNNAVLGQRIQNPKPQNQSRSRPPSYRPPRVEDPAETMHLSDDAAFEAWWNAPDKEEPLSDEDRAFNEWWESEDY